MCRCVNKVWKKGRCVSVKVYEGGVKVYEGGLRVVSARCVRKSKFKRVCLIDFFDG